MLTHARKEPSSPSEHSPHKQPRSSKHGNTPPKTDSCISYPCTTSTVSSTQLSHPSSLAPPSNSCTPSTQTKSGTVSRHLSFHKITPTPRPSPKSPSSQLYRRYTTASEHPSLPSRRKSSKPRRRAYPRPTSASISPAPQLYQPPRRQPGKPLARVMSSLSASA